MHETHRCPSERVTVELMKEAVRQLARGLDYEVPSQNLAVPLTEMPARPLGDRPDP